MFWYESLLLNEDEGSKNEFLLNKIKKISEGFCLEFYAENFFC